LRHGGPRRRRRLFPDHVPEFRDKDARQNDRTANALQRTHPLAQDEYPEDRGEDRFERVDRGRAHRRRVDLKDGLQAQGADGSQYGEVTDRQERSALTAPPQRFQPQFVGEHRSPERDQPGYEKLRGYELDRRTLLREAVDQDDEERETDRPAKRDQIPLRPARALPWVGHERCSHDDDRQPHQVSGGKPTLAHKALQRRDEHGKQVGEKRGSRGRRRLEPYRLQDVPPGEHDPQNRARADVTPPADSGERQKGQENHERGEKSDRDDQKRRHVIQSGASGNERASPDDGGEHEQRFGEEPWRSTHSGESKDVSLRKQDALPFVFPLVFPLRRVEIAAASAYPLAWMGRGP